LGVNCVSGEASIVSPYEVKVGERVITTQNIVIATGGRPAVPAIKGIEQVPFYTSDTIWNLHAQPAHLLVIGAGPIGCELAQAFSRLGSEVTIVSRGEHILPKEDPDVSEVVLKQMRSEGVNVALAHYPIEITQRDQDYEMLAEHLGSQQRFRFTHLLVATGRRANTESLGLDALGIELSDDGTIAVDDYLRTRFPNIYAVGDVAGPYQFTHAASHQAWYAAVNALFGRFKSFKADYSVIPWATFTDPEVARVGLSETEAREKGIDFDVTRYDLDDLDRAIADGETQGFVKVITPKGKDKILGATIVGYHAGELINEFIATMKRGGRLNDILSTIHIYPTLGEANKFAAGEWKKARKPEKLLAYVQRFHRWSRS
jgi:pyruvate/2-oxoglutarate dehydrogenase complex dihydrolipoamide dehydrogenase (E3) component